MVNSLSKWLKDHPVPAFFVLTFLIAWSIWLPLGIVAPGQVLFTLVGAWAPTISAILLIGLSEGRDGVRRFLQKVLHWRVAIHWYLVVLFGIAGLASLAIGIGILLGIPVPEIILPDGLPQDALFGMLPIIFLINIFLGGPLAEDIGWRGYILPKLHEHMNTLQASLLIGIIWAIWHIPFFLFPEWQGAVGNMPLPVVYLTDNKLVGVVRLGVCQYREHFDASPIPCRNQYHAWNTRCAGSIQRRLKTIDPQYDLNLGCGWHCSSTFWKRSKT